MERALIVLAAGAAAALLSGCSHHAEIAAPGGLPYACADGRTARIHYSGGDPNRAAAVLSFDGREFRMAPDPAISGLRYRSDEGLAPGLGLVWASEGDDATLIEVDTEGERALVRCTRVREGKARRRRLKITPRSISAPPRPFRVWTAPALRRACGAGPSDRRWKRRRAAPAQEPAQERAQPQPPPRPRRARPGAAARP